MDFEVVVIGSGPGGYVAAIRAAQLGLKTACIEKYKSLGGTCLNVGCIPSKALLQSSELFHHAQTGLGDHGISPGDVTLDLTKMMDRKVKVVGGLTQGIAELFKKNGVTHFQGTASLLGGGEVSISGEERRKISGKQIVLATGSKPVELPFLKFDGDLVVDSTAALSFEKVPERLIVIGAGVIGLELGSVWARLGAKVTVIEYLDRVLPPMDGAVSREVKKLLTRQGLQFHLSTKVTGAAAENGKVVVQAENKKGERQEFEGDKVLVAVGRKPYTQGLGLEKAGVTLDNQGRIEIDNHFKTGVEGIYAIGDVVRGLMLAHKAEDEGVALAELLAGKAGHVNYDAIPNIVYTWPEVAAVGKTEETLKEEGTPYRVGQFPFKATARARCMNDTDGFVKILAHEKTDRILGAHIVGPYASELIQECVLAMEYAASAEDLARTVHGHPTLSEALKEAALSVDRRTIHI